MKSVKEIMALTWIMFLLGVAANSFATSPMPEEVKPSMTATVCTIHITFVKDPEKGKHEELTSTFAFKVSEAKTDVLEWVTRYVNNKLNELNVSEFKVNCRFPKH